MNLDDSARELIGPGADATLVTLNPDGSPQITVVWVALKTTPEGDDEIVTAHLGDHKKVRNVRRDPRVAVTILGKDEAGALRPYLAINGTAHITEGGAPELLRELAPVFLGPNPPFPPDDAPPGFLTRIQIDKIGGIGPWAATNPL